MCIRDRAIHDSIDISLMMYHNPYYSTVLLDDRFIAKTVSYTHLASPQAQ